MAGIKPLTGLTKHLEQNRRAALNLLKPDRPRRNHTLFPLVKAHPVSELERTMLGFIHQCRDPFAGTVLDSSKTALAGAASETEPAKEDDSVRDMACFQQSLLAAAARNMLADKGDLSDTRASGPESHPKTDLPQVSRERATVLLERLVAQVHMATEKKTASVQATSQTGQGRRLLSTLSPSESHLSRARAVHGNSSDSPHEKTEQDSINVTQRATRLSLAPGTLIPHGPVKSTTLNIPDQTAARQHFSDDMLSRRLMGDSSLSPNPGEPEFQKSHSGTEPAPTHKDRLAGLAAQITESLGEIKHVDQQAPLAPPKNGSVSPGLSALVRPRNISLESLLHTTETEKHLVGSPVSRKRQTSPISALPFFKEPLSANRNGSNTRAPSLSEDHPRPATGFSDTEDSDQPVYRDTRSGIHDSGLGEAQASPLSMGTETMSKPPYTAKSFTAPDRENTIQWLDDDDLGKRVSDILRRQAKRRGVDLP